MYAWEQVVVDSASANRPHRLTSPQVDDQSIQTSLSGVDLAYLTENNAFSVLVNCPDAGEKEPFCVMVLCYGHERYSNFYKTFGALKQGQPYAFEYFALVERVEAGI